MQVMSGHKGKVAAAYKGKALCAYNQRIKFIYTELIHELKYSNYLINNLNDA